jgi:hypothetical protein
LFDRQGPSAFPRPDCAGGCGSSMGTNPGRTHRFYTGKAVLDEGLLPLCLPILVCMKNPYKMNK